jgi:hypothetical protein
MTTEIATPSKSRHGIYGLGDGAYLFVPNEEMWALHEASKPTAICERAGLSRQYHRQVIKRLGQQYPWLNHLMYAPRLLPPTEANGFKFTDEMTAFRNEASIESILAAAPRPKEKVAAAWRSDRAETVTDSLLSHWRRKFSNQKWFDSWLLRGESPPEQITVAPPQLVSRFSAAWDIQAIRRRARVGSESYNRWLKLGRIPSLEWLKWLFGAPAPTAVFVVDVTLQRLRREMGQEAIIAHLKLRAFGNNDVR